MEESFNGFSIKDICAIIYEHCERNKVRHPFNKATKLAGTDFVSGFLKRHSSLFLRKPRVVSLNRVYGLNETSVEKYFNFPTTVLTAWNATGLYIPQMLVFKHKGIKNSLLDNTPSGTIGGCSDISWITTELFH